MFSQHPCQGTPDPRVYYDSARSDFVLEGEQRCCDPELDVSLTERSLSNSLGYGEGT